MSSFNRAVKLVQRLHQWSGPVEDVDLSNDTFFTQGIDKKRLFMEITNLRKKYNQLVTKDSTYDQDKQVLPFNKELSSDEKKRLRYAHSIDNKYQMLGPRWGTSFSLFLSICPMRKHVHRFLTVDFDIRKFLSANALFEFLKQLSIVAKQYNEKFSPFWYCLVNLETFGWHVSGEITQDVRQEIEDWVVKDIRHGDLDGSVTNFEKVFSQVAKEQLSKACTGPYHVISLNDWLDDIHNYCLNGATHLETKLLLSDGSRPRHTKTSAYLSLTKQFLFDWILTFEKDIATIIMKKETGKARPVINAGDHMYLQMSYIDSFLNKRIRSTYSTLFMSQMEIFSLKARTIHMIGEKVSLPLDQSNFDHQPTNEMVLSILYAVQSILPQQHEYRRVMDLIILQMKVGTIIHFPTGGDITRKKGICSGWKWTAFLDTWINITTFFVAVRLLHTQRFTTLLYNLFNAQGDDDLIMLDNEAHALLLIEAYKRMNFAVNEKKFFISRRYHEYLRILYTNSGSTGYPARSIVSLLVRSPITKDPISGLLRARQQANNWKIAIDRGCKAHKHLLRDISIANNMTCDQVDAWLKTPACLGGFGWNAFGESGVSLSEGRVVRSNHISNIKLLRNVDMITEKILIPMIDDTSKGELIKGEVRTVRWKFRTYHIDLNNQLPIHASFRSENKFYNEVELERCISNKNWVSVFQLLDQSLIPFARRLFSIASRHIFIDWLRGSLPFSMPNIDGWNQADLSPLWSQITRAAWAAACRRATLRRNNLYDFVWSAECYLRKILPPYHLAR